MNKKKLLSLLVATAIMAGNALPAMASVQNNPDVYPFPGGKTFADKSSDDDEFTLQYEGGNATHINLRDYLLNENVDPDSVTITGGEWKEGITDENCNPTTAKEWTLYHKGYYIEIVDGEEVKVPTEETITLLDYETPKAVESYELNYTDDSAELRVLTSKVNRMVQETKDYDGITGAKYTVDYNIVDNVAYITVLENGKYFWRQTPNNNLTGLEIYEKDPVLTATVYLDAEKNEIENFVQSIYRLALDRTPDQAGFLYWTNALRAQDVSGRYVLENLLNEKEYKNMTISAEEFVNDMYAIITDRDPDEEGYNYWINRYNETVERIAHELIDVQEGEKYHTAEGLARVEILQNMMNESEFETRCNNMGIKF